MPRNRRSFISKETGCFHIISRTARDTIMFDDIEKEYFYKLLKRFALGFFVEIHTFCVMGTHFHILATGLDLDAKKAGKNLNIFSPGVGIQGGNANEVISAGTNYLIVGRTILNAKNPASVAEKLQLQSLGK